MRVSKTINHGNVRWRATASLQGKRKQRFFASRDEARAWLKTIETDSTGFWLNRTPEEKQDMIFAFNLASKREQSLYQCVLNSPTRVKPLSLTEAINRYLQAIQQRALRPASLKQIHLHLAQLSARFSEQLCHQVLPSHLEEWFHSLNWKRSTIDGVLAKIGPFFNWCIRENYCENNPCKDVKRPRSDDSAPAIFSPTQTEKLLKTTLQEDPGMIPYLAIGLFAGVRPLEIERLQKQDITERYIEITAANAKTRKRRLVNIAANLKKWLKISEELPPANKTKRLSRILKKTGLNWKPDIMRHSFASYHLALHESADKTALEMGHRDTQMLFRHYRELVTKEEAKAYWEIKP